MWVHPQLCSWRQCVLRPLSEPLSHFSLTVQASDLSMHAGKLLIKTGLSQVPSWKGTWICSEEGCNNHFRFCMPTYSPQSTQTDKIQVTHCACCAYFLFCFARQNRLKLVSSFPLVPPMIENYQGRENKTEILLSQKAFQLNGFFFNIMKHSCLP